MVPKVRTSRLAMGFVNKLAPAGWFFSIEHRSHPTTLVNSYKKIEHRTTGSAKMHARINNAPTNRVLQNH
jgi:hypothetical protein